MPSQKKLNFLICGLGSIGKVHLQKIIDIADNVIIIDPDMNTKDYLKSNSRYKNVQHFASFAVLEINLSDFITIVSNWGPDHFAMVNLAHNLDCRRFLIEKPLVSKIDSLIDLRNKVETKQIDIISNLPWSYGNLAQLINELSIRHKLGAVASLVVEGGAKCLVTNGIHYVGLAMKIYESLPSSVISSLNNSEINPRSSDFCFIEGTSVWTFPNNKYLTVSFVNNSHLQISIRVIFKFGRLLIEGNEAKVFSISQKDKSLIDKPSKTYQASELVQQFELFNLDSRIDGMNTIYRDICDENSVLWHDFRHGFDTTEAIFAMLISHEEKARIEFPLSINLTEKYTNREWHIS